MRFAALALGLVACGFPALPRISPDDAHQDSAIQDGSTTDSTDAPPFSGGCSPTNSTQCADCMDNDADGKIDGFDPECTGPADNDEGSFATGIPGDNTDATHEDCFFDGNSGSGDDGCTQHVCCLLQATSATQCASLAPQSNASQYQPTNCYAPFGSAAIPPMCTGTCGPITPPGCDCFGCCTVCNSTGGCRDIALTPQLSPTCNASKVLDAGPDGTLDDADDPCRRCVKNPNCGSPTCGGQTCILCPGQDPSTLPATCGSYQCPSPEPKCDVNGNCQPGKYCSNGCCVGP